jgi:hypothetical protein
VPAIGDPVPNDVASELSALRAAVGRMVPAKAADNVLIGTWNVRDLDRVFDQWRSAASDSPIRDLSDVLCIAEIAGSFDVLAVQEVRRSAQAFRAMMSALGPGWAYLVTDVTEGNPGNNERLAFVFDTTRLRPSGLACELVVAADAAGIPPGVLTGQFARTPYAVSFARGPATFTLVTLHVVYGNTSTDRIAELTEIADWLARWNASGDAWGANLIALGDFNIDRSGDPLYQALTSTGLRPPDPLNLVPRTVFDDPDPNGPAGSPALLRPDRLVPQHGRHHNVHPRLPQRRNDQLRHRDHPRRQHRPTVLADLRPLPALVRIRNPDMTIALSQTVQSWSLK